MAVVHAPHFTSKSDSLQVALRQAKFAVPQLPRRFLARDRPVSKLRSLVEFDSPGTRVTLVSAPIGYGKTTLLASAARELALGKVAWCQLDDADNDPDRFGLSILEAVLASESPDLINQAARTGRVAGDPLDEAMLIVACGADLTLVLDACEHLRPDVASATLRRLVLQAPPNLSIVIGTSRNVPLQESRHTTVHAMHVSDLLFSPGETRGFFEQERIALTDEIEAVGRWTEGVPGVLSAAMATLNDPSTRDLTIMVALRSEGTAFLALFDLMLEHLEPARRNLLVACSLTDPISSSLAATLTGDQDSHRLLDEFVREGIFLDAIPGALQWYRHRHPSRELLMARLLHERRDDVQSLSARAGRWFAEHGDHDRALAHSAHGNDPSLLFDLVRTRWVRSSIDEVDAKLDDIPVIGDNVSGGIEGSLAATAIDIEHGNQSRASQRLASVSSEACLSLRSADSELFELLLRLRLGREIPDPPAIETNCRRILEWRELNSTSRSVSGELEAAALRSQAEAALISGDLDLAVDRLDRSGKESAIQDGEQQTVAATAALAVVTALTGRTRRAAALIEELSPDWVGTSRFSIGVCAIARAACAYHADNLLAADAAATQARATLRPGVYADVILPFIRARLRASVGDDTGAHRLRARATANGDPRLIAVLNDAFGMEPILIPESEVDPIVLAQTAPHPYTLAREWLTIATRHYASGQLDDALLALEHSLAGIERHSFMRIALDSEHDLRWLLRDYIAQARPFSQVAWHLLRRMPTPTSDNQTPNVETLTERELAVLRQLPTMKSNQEIAAEMFFSVNTIKTHLKSIYRKLGVNRRRAAVEEARGRALL